MGLSTSIWWVAVKCRMKRACPTAVLLAASAKVARIAAMPRYFPALRLTLDELQSVQLRSEAGPPTLVLVDAAGVPQSLWYLDASGLRVDAAATRLAFDFLVERGRAGARSGTPSRSGALD